MGKGAKLPTPDAAAGGGSRAGSPLSSLSPKSITEHRDSVLTTADRNIWTELVKRRGDDLGFGSSTQQASSSSPYNSRLPSRGPSPVEFRPRIQESPDKSLVFPKRRRSERRPSGVAVATSTTAARAYELIPALAGPKRDDAPRMSTIARKKSSLSHLIPGGGKEFFDAATVSQKLDWIGLQMRVPEYLENLRGASRDNNNNNIEENGHNIGGTGGGGVPPYLGHRRGSLVLRDVEDADGAGGEKRPRGSSVVVLPVNPKHWLLQSLRLQDSELQELFDQMEDVPQLTAYNITEVREEWEALDGRAMKSPPEVEMLVRDQALLDKVKNLLTRFIEIEEANRRNREQDSEAAAAAADLPSSGDIPPSLFQGFERNQEGNLLPVFSKGSSLCSLCGQTRPKKAARESASATATPSPESPASPHALPSFIPVEDYVVHQSIVQPLGHEMEYKSTYSPQEKRWYTVLFPALQPGKREDVQLLGEWLQHAAHNRKCEDPDGHIADIECSFMLHSIAFLEVVRQVSLECEERGDMLLHVWRQLLRIFNQVMARAEPKINAVWAELLHLKDVLALDRQRLAALAGELDAFSKKLKLVAEQLKQKNLQFARLQRCRLCLAENLTPRAREKFVRRATMKHFAGTGTKMLQLEEEKSAEELIQDSLAAMNNVAHAPDESSASVKEGEKGCNAAEAGADRGSLGGVEGEPGGDYVGDFLGHSGTAAERGGATPGVGLKTASGPAGLKAAGPPVPASPGEIIPGSASRASTRISQGYIHNDGQHVDVPVQTDDPEKKHPFWEVLQRPRTAPPRMNTAGMEVFEPLTPAQSAQFLKEKREKRLARDADRNTRKAAGRASGESGDDEEPEETAEGLRSLAADTVELLEQVELGPAMATRMRGLLAKLRRLKAGGLGADGVGLDDLEGEDEYGSEGGALEGGPDGEGAEGAGKKRGKKGAWGKVRKGMNDGKRGSSQFAAVAEELMALKKRGSSGVKPLKPKDLPFVPLGFAKLMKISSPPKVVKSFNERQLTKLLEGLYAAKILADAVDDVADNERQTACEFVYDYMLNTYGLKGLAESAVHGIFKKIKQMIMSKGIDKCHKVRLFQRFCGFDPARAYAEPDLYLYLKVLQRAGSKVGVMYTEQDDGINFLNCTLIEYLTDEPNLVAHFGGAREVVSDFINKFAALHATTEKTSPELQKIVKLTHVKRLDFDLLMEAIIECNPHKEVKRTARLKPTQKITPLTKEEETELEDLFIAGDANQDGVLTFNEFREIISSADASVSNQNALRMFRETLLLMPDGGDSISPQAFATVAHAHGIKAPAEVVFHLLKKTWDQIQDDINEDKMKEAEQKEEAAELRAKLVGLLESGTNATDAVQTFRAFVLQFCGGKEGADEKPASDDGADDESE